MKLSPAHYKHALVTPTADTDAKKVGRVVHLAAFEPERFRNAVAVWDGARGAARSGKRSRIGTRAASCSPRTSTRAAWPFRRP
jgi:hypothetical protein